MFGKALLRTTRTARLLPRRQLAQALHSTAPALARGDPLSLANATGQTTASSAPQKAQALALAAAKRRKARTEKHAAAQQQQAAQTAARAQVVTPAEPVEPDRAAEQRRSLALIEAGLRAQKAAQDAGLRYEIEVAADGSSIRLDLGEDDGEYTLSCKGTSQLQLYTPSHVKVYGWSETYEAWLCEELGDEHNVLELLMRELTTSRKSWPRF